ncbi:MAG: hypothetical protein HYX33_02545 [Actinobacteria bacterium]|nr:hypothetical protein [Actinomycetota bacterium]
MGTGEKGIGDMLKDAVDGAKGKAEELIKERGGVEGLKADAAELKDIATGEGSLSDKAKAAVQAIKDPGKAGDDGA